MRKVSALILVFSILMAAAASPIQAKQEAASIFKDIKGHWAEKVIVDMVNQGILDGYPDGTFRPEEPVKIDQFIKMLILSYSDLHQNGERSWKSSFLQSLSAENQSIIQQDYRYFNFKPNPSGYWAANYINIASDLHLLNKNRYSDFQANMNREHVAEVLYYTLNETEFLEDEKFSMKEAEAYGDLKSATEREQKFIAEALVKGIMQGYPSGYFGVGDTVTRAESLVILNRLTDKSKRLKPDSSKGKLSRSVPTSNGGYKVIVFPDQRMYDAYAALKQAGQTRGVNYDFYESTLRLYKDQEEKNNVQKQPAGSNHYQEEVTMSLDTSFNTYSITVRMREGTLARNQEAVKTFANFLFGYNASSFNDLFIDVTGRIQNGEKVESRQVLIGSDNVNIQVDPSGKSVMFSISAKSL
ncbi:S-layer homology domain-containing protein [Paenibacillus sp. 1001270B_150601_E10]|uniref:S-layer homology domain-containing protein n=1 Tax=Paenibacillus sp. 1001270B_150601_E10 TaxID=2787079 RepID=UPI00189F3546|nr:S-layer homology domain-containing protein [Paenibacillus sp. 1001270B_150601_E10]